jgi:anti-sigma-K factor RskA
MSEDGTDIGAPEDPDDLAAAEYVLGVLDAQDRRELARRAAVEPELARKIEAWQLRLSPLDAAYEPVPPPAGALAAIEARLFGAPRQADAPGGWWNSLAFWRTLAGAAAVVAVIAVATALVTRTGPDLSSGGELVASLEAEDTDTRLVSLYDPDAGALRITPVAVVPVEDRDFELWLIEGGDDPISLGLVSQSANQSIEIPQDLRPRFHAGAVLAITLEPLGGTPTGVATGPIVAIGETAEI